MSSCTHPYSRHHIHSFQDCRELLEQRGYTFDENASEENATDALAVSKEKIGPLRCYLVRLCKQTKALTVTDNTQPE